MRKTASFEFPAEQQQAMRKARRLEWITILYMASVIVLMYLVMGSSQAMKSAWLEDMLSLVPPIVFLVAGRIAQWAPTKRFPYGFHRAVAIAFLCASVALFAVGAWLLYEAVSTLVKAERPSIGGMTVLGETVWQGWLMIPVLLYSGIPIVFLGRAKLPLASGLHDKVLYVDAQMNKADWMTAGAALVGVLGIGMGFWWADAVAAGIISLDIIRDGVTNLKRVVLDLLDETPRTVKRDELDPLPGRVQAYLAGLPWVRDAAVRMREDGHVFFGEAFVIVEPGVEDLPQKLEEAAMNSRELDWRLHDLVVVPSSNLDGAQVSQPS